MLSISIKLQQAVSSILHFIGVDIPDKKNDDTRLYQGTLKLLVPYPFDEVQPGILKSSLHEVPGLNILSEDLDKENSKYLIRYIINLKQPTPLLKILKHELQGINVVDEGGIIKLSSCQISTTV